MKKRIISTVLALVIMLTACIVPTIFASADAKIAVSSVTAEPGDIVDVDITFKDNPGIMGATLTVSYDEEALTLISVKDGGILGTQSHKPELKSPYTLAWSDDTATVNNTTNGVAATLTFKLSESAVRGQSYPISVSYDYDNYDIYDVNLNCVRFTLENGAVNITAAGEQPTDVPAGTAQIVASDVTAEPGDTVDVDITFANNPGIMGATLTISYDDEALTLTSVKDGGILGAQSHKPELKSPYTLAWSDDTATVNNTSNGIAATLTFKLSERAVRGQSYPISVSYDYDNYDIYDVDLNRVKFTLVNGSIMTSEEEPTTPQPSMTYYLGDANGDGEVDAIDSTIVQRVATMVKVPYDRDKMMNADVDGDGELTVLDATYILRYSSHVKTPYPVGEII